MSRHFRLNTKSLFLTYPTCDYPKEACLLNILHVLQREEVVQAVVAQETHEDGQPHLHCLIKTKHPIRRNGTQWMDDLAGGSHGNYQGARSYARVLKYITKADPTPAMFGLTEEQLRTASSQSSTLTATIATRIAAGATINELLQDEEIRPFLVLHLGAVQRFLSAMNSANRPPLLSAPPEQLVTPNLPACHSATRVHSWLHRNLGNRNRAHRAPQLWLHGPPATGKTSLMNFLDSFCRIYFMPPEHWQDTWEDDAYDVAVLDEYNGSQTVSFLNAWLSGDIMPIRRRNQSAYTKRHRIPTIILSNLTPAEVYSNVHISVLAALESRLEFISLNHDENLFSLLPPQ